MQNKMVVSVFIPQPPFCTKLTFVRIDLFGPKGSWWTKKALIMLKFLLKSGQSLSGRVDELVS